MIYNITDLIEDDYEVVKFKKKDKEFEIKIRGISAYDIAEMWKEESLRDVLKHLFNELDKKDSETIYDSLIGRAPELISVFIAICDYDKQATPEIVKRMPVSAQIQCFSSALNQTFHMEEQDKIEENLKKLVAEALLLMNLFVKEEKKNA